MKGFTVTITLLGLCLVSSFALTQRGEELLQVLASHRSVRNARRQSLSANQTQQICTKLGQGCAAENKTYHGDGKVEDLCNSTFCNSFLGTHDCFIFCVETCSNDHAGDEAAMEACANTKCMTCTNDASNKFPSDDTIAEMCTELNQQCQQAFQSLSRSSKRQSFEEKIIALCDEDHCNNYFQNHRCFFTCASSCESVKNDKNAYDKCMKKCFECTDNQSSNTGNQGNQGNSDHDGGFHSNQSHNGNKTGNGSAANRTRRIQHRVRRHAIARRNQRNKYPRLSQAEIEEFCETIADQSPCSGRRLRRQSEIGDLCDEGVCVPFIHENPCYPTCHYNCDENGEGEDCYNFCFNCMASPPPPPPPHRRRRQDDTQDGVEDGEISPEDTDKGRPDLGRLCQIISEDCAETGHYMEEPARRIANRQQKLDDLCQPDVCQDFLTTHECFFNCEQYCDEQTPGDRAAIDACLESECLKCKNDDPRWAPKPEEIDEATQPPAPQGPQHNERRRRSARRSVRRP